jgi:hypothetical protein
MSIPFLSIEEWRDEFGSKAEQAFDLLVPSLFKVKNGQVYLNLELEKFEEIFDLFDVDPELVAETIDLSNVFADPEIDPEIITVLLYLCEERLGYSPIDAAGSFVITFDDFRKYYGEKEFDKHMNETYGSNTYHSLKDLLTGVEVMN